MSRTVSREATRPFIERVIHRLYVLVVLPLVKEPLSRQRLKLIYYAPGYWRILFERSRLSILERLRLVRDCLRIDWFVEHGHTPAEMARLATAIAQERSVRGRCILEAGCWHGGSTAKFSLMARRFGLALHAYDSFAGVEDVSKLPGEWDYSGQYASPEATVRANVEAFGDAGVLTTHPGWFADTLARDPAPVPVAVAYIDCDIAKGTYEALQGILPSLAPDGIIFSQDFHIAPVSALLTDKATWDRLGVAPPEVTRYHRRLVSLQWPAKSP